MEQNLFGENPMILIGALFWLIWTIWGTIIGGRRNRAGLGAILGFFLGPLGLIVIWAMQPPAPPCPQCGGRVVKGAIKCRHCGSTIAVIPPPPVPVQ